MTTAIETTATIGEKRQLLLDVDLPTKVSTKVRVIVLIDEEEDFNEDEWLESALGNDVFEFLKDESEDIYTSEDGKPIQNEI